MYSKYCTQTAVTEICSGTLDDDTTRHATPLHMHRKLVLLAHSDLFDSGLIQLVAWP